MAFLFIQNRFKDQLKILNTNKTDVNNADYHPLIRKAIVISI